MPGHRACPNHPEFGSLAVWSVVVTEVLPPLDQRVLLKRLFDWIAERSSRAPSCIPAISIPKLLSMESVQESDML